MSRLWDGVVHLSLVLWVSRVSVISTAIGAILFICIPQVHDTFLEVRTTSVWDPVNVAFWSFFLLSVVFLWALPVHYAARRDLDLDPSFLGKPRSLSETWVPRVLAVFCLVSVAIGAYRAQSGLLSPPDSTFYADAHTQTLAIMWMAIVLAAALLLFLIWRQNIFSMLSPKVGAGLMILLGIIFFVLFLPDPVQVSRLLWRAPLIPLLLGGWVPILAWLAYKGRQYRVPFILLAFLGLEGLAYFGDNHEVRRVWVDHLASVTEAPPKPGAGFKRERIHQAIDRWQEAHECGGSPKNCPRPIIVAASGGASRAGFFTAGVLGELMDRSNATRGTTQRNLRGLHDFKRQLFAISTVSGSSAGAAFFLAALDRSDAPTGKTSNTKVVPQPCMEDTDNLVYFTGKPKTWRQCMEQLLAGDFISPTLYGLVYKDAIRGLAPIARYFGLDMRDRAEILELAWEDRFCLGMTGKVCEPDDFTGMRAPFLSASGRDPASTSDKAWTPILLLNGTDAGTGRRVVIAPINPRMEFGKPLFPDAYDLHDLLANTIKPGTGPTGLWDRAFQSSIVRDVPLSTAAMLSARFPIISPPGNILNAQDQIITRVIDGGYFENYGAATAWDIATQLKKTCVKNDKGIEECLNPFVIEITNDPSFLVPNLIKENDQGPQASRSPCKNMNGQDPLKLPTPAVVDAPDRLFLAEFRGPIGGLLAARGAQGGRALRALSDLGSKNFLHISVSPLYVPDSDGTCKVADVSMSWWLSKQVQKYLDDQIDVNCKGIDRAILDIRKAQPTLLAPPGDLCAGPQTSAN
ncbi:hypothetical protein [Methyloceanibacter sp.]|uniref:hypothetical protein n=1 Tax=Methyloceanibacter sp. TaxID=1965321 RepID=UPI00356A8810